MTDWRHHYQGLPGYHEEANDFASCRCPFHEDRRASMRLNLRSGWVECMAGCGDWGPTEFADRYGMPRPSRNGNGKSGGWISYVYTDAQGTQLFRVSRTPDKQFPQSHWDGSTWQKGLTRADGTKVPRVLYRLQALAAADSEAPVFMPEGEKDADNLASLGLVSTTFAGGAGKSGHTPAAALEVLRNRRVYVLADNDEPGRQHAREVLELLDAYGALPHLLDLPDLPEKGDVSDWLAAGGTRAELLALACLTSPWTRPEPPLSLAEAARLVGMHLRTLQRAVQSGALRATAEERPQGTRYTVTQADLRAWATSRGTRQDGAEDATEGGCRVDQDATEDPCRVDQDATEGGCRVDGTRQDGAEDATEGGCRVDQDATEDPCRVPCRVEPGYAYHRTDLGNAERLVDRHGMDLRYSCGRWLCWSGGRWLWDETGEVARRCAETVRSIYLEALDADKKEAARIRAHAKRSEASPRLRAIAEIARAQHPLPVAAEALDADPWLLCCANGTVDLRTGKLRPHRREDLATRQVPVDYDPDAECPRWWAFLDRIFAGNPNLIRFIQRAVGYSLTGLTREQCLFILWGSGANGKSTFLEVVLSLAGDYGCSTPSETLMASRGDNIPNDLARLRGVRTVKAVESEEGRRLAEGLVKQITGEDKVSARFMRAEWFDFKPQFKLWLATNHRPEIRGTDDGIWRRIRLVPFTVQIPKEEQDPNLAAALQEELPGILAWAVRGCLEWQRMGLNPPEEVLAATDSYRSEMDILASFLGECCVLGENCKAGSSDLYKAYTAWCERSGEKAVTQRRFGRQLTERGLEKFRDHSGRTVYRNLGLLTRVSETDEPSEGLTNLPTEKVRPENPDSIGLCDQDEPSEPFSPRSSYTRAQDAGESEIGSEGSEGSSSPSYPAPYADRDPLLDILA